MNQFWMSATRNSKTWVTILSKTVGSTTSLMFRIGPWGKTGCHGEVLMRKAPSSSPFFFCPHEQWRHCNGLAMWHGYVLKFFVFHFGFFSLFLFFLLVSFSTYSCIVTFLQLVVLGGSVIACCSIQRHIMALESNIDIYKSVLLPMCEPDHEHTSQHVAPQRGSVFAPPPRNMEKRNFDLLCE